MISAAVIGGMVGGCALCGAYFAPQAMRYMTMPGLRRRLVQSRSVVLTYDDGPGERLTPQVLDLLDSHDAKATFFLLGSRAVRRPSVVDLIASRGHEIGCHGRDHLNGWKTWPWKAAADVEGGYKDLSRWTPPNSPFRPPYGKLSLPGWLAVLRRGATVRWWTIDSGDTHDHLPPPQQVADAVVRAGGGIVLLHDFDRSRERCEFVLRTTELLLDAARREGISVCRFCDPWPVEYPTTKDRNRSGQ